MKLPVFAVALCALSVQAAEQPITLSSLLDEMTDRDALTRFPEPCYKMRLWSSHSRQSVAPDKPGWFANWDWNNFVREETNAVGEVERVMVDAEGPGALVRAWVTGNAAGISTLRVYVDGAAKPLFEGVVTNLVGGSAICGAPLSQGLSPATPLEKQGFNLFLPIPYARHLKVAVVMPKPKETFYYNFETRTWPAGTAVESASKEVMSAAAKKVAAVNAILAQADEPVPDGETKAFGGTLAPGERKTVSFAGQGAIRHLQMRPVCPRDTSVYMWGDEETCVRDVEIQLAFDGVTTVKMPVGAFFNAGIWGCDYHLTRFTSVMSNLVMSCRWVMPFAKSFEMTLVNTGDRPVVLKDAKVVKGDYSWDARSMRFGATYVPRPDVPTRKKGLPYDVAFENLKGRGLVVGTSVMVDNPARCWWGEGDEKVWLDGERDPSYIGTGTEDFFCYAWCQHAPFSHPFVTQPCGDGNGDGAAYGGYAVNFRARQLDAIPFRSSIRFDMELWHWADVRVSYDTVSWHYLVPQPVAAEWPGFARGMGIGGWLTNYKRFNVLPENQRMDLTVGDYEHFESYITEADVKRIKDWGFDHVRVGFDQIVMEETPFRYRERTFRLLDAFVGWCAKHKLNVVLNLHKAVGNYCDIKEKKDLLDSDELQNRVIALWVEIERRYHDRPGLAFELLNEVRDVDPEKWNACADRMIRAIREKNATRPIVVGATCWNDSFQMSKSLKVWDDPNVIYTFHMYAPFEFTHQRGVLMAGPLHYNRVLEYPSSDVDRYRGYHELNGNTNAYPGVTRIDAEFLAQAMWGAGKFLADHPDKVVWLGEFGTIRHAPKASRVAYMRDVIAYAKAHGIPWCVWNYLSTPNDGNRFSLVDDDTREFLSPELLKACLGE